MIYLLLFIVIIFTKYFINSNKAKKTKFYLEEYENWLTGKETKCENLAERSDEVKKLVRNAGYGKGNIPVTQTTGYGVLANFTTNPINAFPNSNKAVAHGIISDLVSSIGVYKRRARESFSPLFWITSVIFLPQKLLSYLGFSYVGQTVKVVNIIWWILGTVVTTIILNAYNSELTRIVRNLFE